MGRGWTATAWGLIKAESPTSQVSTLLTGAPVGVVLLHIYSEMLIWPKRVTVPDLYLVLETGSAICQ